MEWIAKRWPDYPWTLEALAREVELIEEHEEYQRELARVCPTDEPPQFNSPAEFRAFKKVFVKVEGHS
jgi:hypothetical protein